MIAQLKQLQTQTSLPGYVLPPVPQTGTRVILLRHGRSTLNDQGRYQGSSDTGELTPEGMAASHAIGRYLKQCPVDAIYVSPLKRAQDTAAALLPHLTTPPLKNLSTSDLLKEIHLPSWEGQRYEDVRSHQPDLYRCWQETPDQFQLSSGASTVYPVQDLYQQAQRFWQTILPRHSGQTLLVVSHGGTNQALINTALKSSASQHHLLQQTHSGLTVLDFQTPTDEFAQLHLLNLTLNSDAAAPRLPKLKAGKQGLRLLLLPCQPGIAPDPSLATLLSSEPIQAAVVQDWQDPTPRPHQHVCRQVAKTVLCQNPETVVLSVKRSHFWPQWQAAIENSLHAQQPGTLTTLLAIAQPASVQRFLNTLLALPEDASSLTLQPNTLSVVHYPNAQTRPILQGMNLIAL
ncbi:histidine phosphatase family protein [Oscillatoria sp. CS-180]|uniref:histidine phosphatase family protein n=1 Tax=Oscillatoria sp. CS-180 TaxID=3021720 RepID=UPI002330C050|nr:histidine phosphatase family protein [Oscillatoria sp. CS-180]MDB9525367.1 histidine phosphatase family protein [Oscillatoria sp. CS-180]